MCSHPQRLTNWLVEKNNFDRINKINTIYRIKFIKKLNYTIL